jgi:SAM-dependent methyltransferase
MPLKVELICPAHRVPLTKASDDSNYACPSGCNYRIVNSVPRFVPDDLYASSFGLQWNAYRTAQLDSHTKLSISSDRLRRLLGGSFDIIRSKLLLEAGCGAGRFTEVLLKEGALVHAVDLSSAVEANYANCGAHPDHFVCQADIRQLPFFSARFDIVICIGVIQHTPNPEETIKALCSQVRPGGMLIIDHYSPGYNTTASRRLLRSLLLRMPSSFSLALCKLLVGTLWPLHRILWHLRKLFPIMHIRTWSIRLSPVVDYHDAYPELGAEMLKVWATLDTHDTLTDYYKHLRSTREIADHLAACGMENIISQYAGNGVEACATKPLSTETG